VSVPGGNWVQEGRHDAHEPGPAIAGRIVAVLEVSRSILGVAVVDDEGLGRLNASACSGDLAAAEWVLEKTIDGVIERVGEAGARHTATPAQIQELLRSLNSVWREIQHENLARQAASLNGVREALRGLRSAETVSQMIVRAAAAACRSCGVDRSAFLKLDAGLLRLNTVHWTSDTDILEEWEHYVRGHPAVLAPSDPETKLIRKRVPVLVHDPETEVRGLRGIAEVAHSSRYVAAPVVVRDQVVATLHADGGSSGRPVDAVTREVIFTFAEGFGSALERVMLVERSRDQIAKMREAVAEAETTVDDLFEGGVGLWRDEHGKVGPVARGPAVLPGESRLVGLLSRREVDVATLMARGASNADIANELVITEATVKSHIHSIFRKLQASNRAQAVSIYLRLESAAQ